MLVLGAEGLEDLREGAARRRTAHQVPRPAQMLEQTGADAHPHQLSGGMAQRVAICRMLVTDPTCSCSGRWTS